VKIAAEKSVATTGVFPVHCALLNRKTSPLPQQNPFQKWLSLFVKMQASINYEQRASSMHSSVIHKKKLQFLPNTYFFENDSKTYPL
jgi:hypothetical protein